MEKNKKRSNILILNSKFISITLGISLRIVAVKYLSEFFELSPELVTPLNSFKRFKEGVFLYDSGIVEAYDGDMFHLMPIFIYLLKPFLHSNLALRILWTLFDILTAEFIQNFVISYIKLKGCNDYEKINQLINFSFVGYLLNPMTIGCWALLSFSSITNVCVSAFMFFIIKNNYLFAIIFLVFAAQVNFYYLILLVVIFVKFKKNTIAVLFTLFLTFIFFTIVNSLFIKSYLKLFMNTIGFSLIITDLTPNVGIFWYFFIEVFEHYRLLFLFAFQFNTLIYIVPLTITLRRNYELLALLFLIFVAIFSSYPSYAETALYLPLLFAFFDLHKFIRYGLFFGGTIATTFFLIPIMWRMWVVTGTGNVNFFFAIVWVFNLAQIFIFADMVSAYLKSKFVNKLEDYEKNIKSIKLIDCCPITDYII